jgi:hypothetical protein
MEGKCDMKKLLLATVFAATSFTIVHAGTKELEDCDSKGVQDTLKRVTHSRVILDTQEVPSDNLTEERWCRSHIIGESGVFREVIYNLRWTSETEGRYWLQVQASRWN